MNWVTRLGVSLDCVASDVGGDEAALLVKAVQVSGRARGEAGQFRGAEQGCGVVGSETCGVRK